ncbi:glycosyltransferase family protein [Swingsia samuiensis]|uniref:Glycosyltransferase family 2 protein n=1 Tax=Swingsia samuiensis TaxID=1293412 RepID=A0A4Y6ULP2_9PROT|nr:glycosyltransferase family 2 protein [Swingsia samuiensis]QDH17301.1 glycosyltransferase family 2 protein [Swingsia samuiensis]
MNPGLHIFSDNPSLDQRPFDVAVVMPSLLRPSLKRAVESVFAQHGNLRVQIMIGVDTTPPEDALLVLEEAFRERPKDWVINVLWPGYSTSQRHGGLGRAKDGGVLRSVLSQLSNAPRIAYLDDDNWWAPHHLQTLLAAIEGYDWAWAGRWFVHPKTQRPICEDQWESVGPGGGIFRETQGGFVDPNCLMIDRTRVPEALDLWNHPMAEDKTQLTADRNVFRWLKERSGRPTGEYSSFYVVRETDGMQPFRLRFMGDLWEKSGEV